MIDDPYEDITGIKRESRDEYQARLDEERKRRLDTSSEDPESTYEVVESVKMISDESTEEVVRGALGIEIQELLGKIDKQLTRLEMIITADSVQSTIEASNIARVARKVLNAEEIVLAAPTRETLQKIVDIYEEKREDDLKKLSADKKRRDDAAYRPR